jgi:hypothetical protein
MHARLSGNSETQRTYRNRDKLAFVRRSGRKRVFFAPRDRKKGSPPEPRALIETRSANDADARGGAHDDGGGSGGTDDGGSGRGRDATGAIDAAGANHGIGRSSEGGKAGEGG